VTAEPSGAAGGTSPGGGATAGGGTSSAGGTSAGGGISSAAGDAPAPGGALEVPPEPVELRDSIRRAVLDGADWQERFGAGLGVGELLWERWGPVLARAGTERGAFEAAVRAYRRELWFWVLGERRWEQAVEGLAGRLLRRTAGAGTGR
jgi:hypothetical protein